LSKENHFCRDEISPKENKNLKINYNNSDYDKIKFKFNQKGENTTNERRQSGTQRVISKPHGNQLFVRSLQPQQQRDANNSASPHPRNTEKNHQQNRPGNARRDQLQPGDSLQTDAARTHQIKVVAGQKLESKSNEQLCKQRDQSVRTQKPLPQMRSFSSSLQMLRADSSFV
jgi:hypothetical protein